MIAQQAEQAPDTGLMRQQDESIRDVAHYLKDHAHESIEIRDVAGRYAMTPVQLTRK